MLEDQLKELFEELNIERRPRTFGAVDVIHHGQEIKSRRRALAVAGSALGTTALVVAVGFALAGLPASTHDPATTPGPVGTSTRTTNPAPPAPTPQPSEQAGPSATDLPHTTAPDMTHLPTTAGPTTTGPTTTGRTAPPGPGTPRATTTTGPPATVRTSLSPPATALPAGPTAISPTHPDPQKTEVPNTNGHTTPPAPAT